MVPFAAEFITKRGAGRVSGGIRNGAADVAGSEMKAEKEEIRAAARPLSVKVILLLRAERASRLFYKVLSRRLPELNQSE